MYWSEIKSPPATVAVRLIDPTQIQVDTLVNEMDIFNIALGSKATIQVTATDTNLDATVAAISPSATSSGVWSTTQSSLKVTPSIKLNPGRNNRK